MNKARLIKVNSEFFLLMTSNYDRKGYYKTCYAHEELQQKLSNMKIGDSFQCTVDKFKNIKWE